jgi:iron complex outermembrane receptor protein
MTGSRVRLTQALLLGAAAAALGGGALAQTAPAPQSSGPVIGEVIVTAQHRTERLHDVPISITARTAEQLEQSHVTTMEDLNTVAPGVRIDDAGEYVQPAMRGVAATTIGPGADAPVAIYLDGVIQPNMQTTHFDFADLDHIEVYKGPQGTLYGRNATGGAIAFFTKAPSFHPHGDFEVGYGAYNDFSARGFITGPIIGDVLAGSLAAYYESHEDYNYNIVTKKHAEGLHSLTLRAKLLFKPTNWATFTLTGGYVDRKDTDPADGVPLNGNSIAILDQSPTHNVYVTTKPHDVALNVQIPIHLKVESVVLNSQFKIGDWGTLTSITSDQYNWDFGPFDDDRTYDLNGAHDAAYLNVQKDPTFTEDVNFTSRKFGPFSFILGGSYFYDNDKWRPVKVAGPNGSTLALINEDQPVKAYAIYTEGTYDITHQLVLTAGIRYSWEHRDASESLFIPNGAGGFVLFEQGFHQPSTTFTSVIPRVSLRYDITPRTNIYFTYSQGFKSGGTSGGTLYYTTAGANFIGVPGLAGVKASNGSTFKPENITAYEAGIKSNITSRLTVNAAAYYYDYTNLQVQIDEGFTSKITENAATARIYGLDADLTARLTDEFSVTAGVALTSAHYVKYVGASVLMPYSALNNTNDPTGIYRSTCLLPSTQGGNGGPAGNCNYKTDASGKSLPRAPDFTLQLSADYKKVFSAGTFDINGNLYYSGRIYFDSFQRVSQSPYAVLALQASFQPAGTHLKFIAWGKNVTNTTYLVSLYEDSQSDGAGYAPPATYGVAIQYSF